MESRTESESSSRSSTEKPPASAKADERVSIGIVGRPHGIEGAFVVVQPTERLKLLDAGRTVTIADRELAIEWRRGTPERPLLKLEARGRGDVEELRGQAITVPRAAIGQLPEGEFLVDELVGCDAYDGARRIGRVSDVLLMPSADLLEVERDGGEPLLVPLVRDAVRSVDLEGRRVDIDATFVDAD